MENIEEYIKALKEIQRLEHETVIYEVFHDVKSEIKSFFPKGELVKLPDYAGGKATIVGYKFNNNIERSEILMKLGKLRKYAVNILEVEKLKD